MRPKMRVSPMPSRAYVPPSTRPFTRCWSSWSIRDRARATSWPGSRAAPPCRRGSGRQRCWACSGRSPCRRARLLDELGRRRAAAGRDDLAAEALLLRLFHHQRDLLDRGGEEERVAAGRLDLGELGVHVGRGLVHELLGADGGALLLQHVAERPDGATAPIGVDGQEVHALDAELVDVLLEAERFHL